VIAEYNSEKKLVIFLLKEISMTAQRKLLLRYYYQDREHVEPKGEAKHSYNNLD
jgi:hypothetical protein